MTMLADPERLRRLLERFEELMDLEAGAREARLSAIEAQDGDTAAELRAMLRADEPSGALELERQLEERADRTEGHSELPVGSLVGPYRIVRKLGRGGMGEVYLATRSHEGFDQAVALKLLRRELADPQSLERFHRECRIQARLSHPAIVPLIDAGLAADGRPWLALQYVDGEPITRYADNLRSTIAERLRLVVSCCRAVEAAHAKLVVHRDLKPSNILVGADGAVRLLDFGIAKGLGGEPDEDLTRQAVGPMTPERAAPEQLRGEPTSTSTDVWGLGVLLYELVTGRLPFEGLGRTPWEIEQEIRERGPTRPSRALPQGTGEAERSARERLAQARSTTPRRLSRELGGDLEVVLARALAPEPDRRYSSVAALADDLERLLAGHPVLARPDSLRYRARRFFGRHRVAATMASIAGLGLITLGIATAVQSVRMERERDRATALEKQSTAVVELLTELFGATSPHRGVGVGDVSIDQLLTEGAEKVKTLADSPGVRQRMFATLGRIRMERSELPAGRALLKTARAVADEAGVDPLAPDRVDLELDYTQALARMDDSAAARTLLEPLVVGLEAAGERQPERLAEALAQLALVVPSDQGPALAERSLALRRQLDPPRPVEVASSLDALANLAFRAGDFPRARAHWTEAVPILEREVGDGDVRTLSTLNNLAVVTEDPGAQIEVLRRVLAGQEHLFGPDSAAVSNTRNNLGVALCLLGRYPEADRELRESHRVRIKVFGVDHRETVRTLRNVARIAELQGHLSEALELFDEVMARLPSTGIPRELWPTFAAQRAAVVWRLGRTRLARREMDRALANLRRDLPSGHEEIAAASLVAARMAASRGDLESAVANVTATLAARQAALPEGHPKLAEARAELGRFLALTGDEERGRAMLRANLPILEPWGLLHPDDLEALRRAARDDLRPR